MLALSTPRDYERLHDQVGLLEQAQLLSPKKAEDVRYYIAREVSGTPEREVYQRLIAEPERLTVDLAQQRNPTEWLTDACQELHWRGLLWDHDAAEIQCALYAPGVDPAVLAERLSLDDLPMHASKAHYRAGALTVGDLVTLSADDILCERVGEKSVAVLREYLAKRGLKFRGE